MVTDEAPEDAATDPIGLDRRTMLGALSGLGTAAVAGCSAFEPDADGPTTGMDAERAEELAERFAPTLYFDVDEPWFPTDPRPYTRERDGETVVDGFAAFDGYHERYDGGDPANPPDPIAFYHGVEYEDAELDVIQFWYYSVFDQFTSNFHWHDWEVLHVFVDRETDEPQLYVASSHSRNVPNNEFLDPDPDVVPRILPELGSHSKTLSVNEIPDGFQRVGDDDLLADITNTTIERIEDLAAIPLAYGLPRDEGVRLPFVIPEFEGAPIYEHERLPNVTRESLIRDALTVRSLDDLRSPPTDLPLRETGLVFRHGDRDEAVDDAVADVGTETVEYDLVASSELEGIDAFTGPQLSFEFSVPQAVEDAMAGHITTTGEPWNQPRYDDPAADITASNHRAVLADRYDAIGDPSSLSAVIARVTEATTTDDAPDDEGLTTTDPSVESVALLESDPEAIPTFGGVAAVQNVDAGDHRLTVNGAGQAPHSEQVTVAADEPVTTAGVDGEIPLVAQENATKLEIDDENADDDVVGTAVEDDFAGRLYESAVDGSDAVYVHAGGAYTAEVRDPDDELGAYRVNPDPASMETVRIDRPETGTASLARFLADIADETRAAVAAVDEADSDDGDVDDDGTAAGDDENGDGEDGNDEVGDDGTSDGQPGNGAANAVQGLENALAAIAEAATKAAERAREGDRGNTDQQLDAVADRLQRATERLDAARDDLPDGLANAAENRLAQAERRNQQARNAEKL